MPFDPRSHDSLEWAPAHAGPRVGGALGPFPRGISRGLTGLALAVAGALIAGLAWDLFATQSQGRESLRDGTERRAALTADLIGSAFTAATPAEQARAQFGGSPRAVRRAVRTQAAASPGRQIAVLDAR